MNVIALPTVTAETDSDRQIRTVLSKAVTAFRASAMHTNSFAGRQKAAAARAYLDSLELMLEKPGLQAELQYHLSVAIFDIDKLARVVRNYGNPDAA